VEFSSSEGKERKMRLGAKRITANAKRELRKKGWALKRLYKKLHNEKIAKRA
jgi:hypothetical protein